MKKYEFDDQATIYCGDTFEGMAMIDDGTVDMLLVDLPYGTTACAWDSVLPLDKLWKEYNRIVKENGAMVFTASQPFTWNLCASNPDNFRYTLVWEKPNGTNPLLVKKQPFKVHEDIVVFYRKQPTYNPQMTYGHSKYSGFSGNKNIGEVFTGGDKNGPKSQHSQNKDGGRYPRSVLKFAQDRTGHPTKKPVDLFRWLIRTYTNPGDLVLDNTIGEGTTAVAAIMENRRVIGIEQNPKYVDRILKDLEQASKVHGDAIIVGEGYELFTQTS